MLTKTIILAWTQKTNNFKSSFWGLGDIIRGTIKMYQYSKINNYELIVNYNLHPISKYLKSRYNKYDEFINLNKDNIPFIVPGMVDNYIKTNKNDIIFFLTNDFCNENYIDGDCKEFIKDILQPNEEMIEFINLYNIKKNYEIMHFRLGDDYLLNNNSININIYNNIKNKIIKNNHKLSIIISDSLELKKN
jgi:hypothetical protein